jgi:CRP-like cAMP-binding protein
MKTYAQGGRFAALRAAAELAACSDADIRSLLAYSDEVRMCAGDSVAQEGRYCAELVVVIEGTLCSGSHLVGPGGTIGWDEMWERSTNPTTVTAETDARLLVMSHEQFRAVKALVGPGPARSQLSQQALMPQPFRRISLLSRLRLLRGSA